MKEIIRSGDIWTLHGRNLEIIGSLPIPLESDTGPEHDWIAQDLDSSLPITVSSSQLHQHGIQRQSFFHTVDLSEDPGVFVDLDNPPFSLHMGDILLAGILAIETSCLAGESPTYKILIKNSNIGVPLVGENNSTEKERNDVKENFTDGTDSSYVNSNVWMPRGCHESTLTHEGVGGGAENETASGN